MAANVHIQLHTILKTTKNPYGTVLACLGTVLLSVHASFGLQAAGVTQAFPAQTPMRPAPKQALPKSLEPNRLAPKEHPLIELPPVRAEEITAADAAALAKSCCGQQGFLRVGFARSAGSEPLSLRHAVRWPKADGNSPDLWTMKIRSPGAHALRLHFTNTDLGDGTIVVYAQGKELIKVRGPFSRKGPLGTGEFWTAPLFGDTVVVEFTGQEDARFQIPQVMHFDQNVYGPDSGGNPSAKVLNCHLDVMCSSIPAAARDAVGRMSWVTDPGPPVMEGLCSGTLLNDRDDETVMPYFLTAYHCLHTQTEVNTLHVVWFYQTPSCNGTPPNISTLPESLGGTLLRINPTDSGNDMTFIRLDGDLPGGVGLAGWTTDYANSSYGAHHPDGSWKRCSSFADNWAWFCAGSTANYHILKMIGGMIEHGSSGSPLLNDSGQVMGQLLGRCWSSGGEPDCDTDRDDYRARYGKFSITYDFISYWLHLGGTIWVDHSYTGGEIGTDDKPFNTVGEGVGLAWNGCQIKIRGGSYPETMTISKQVTLRNYDGAVTIGN
jgi:hypothetical protein